MTHGSLNSSTSMDYGNNYIKPMIMYYFAEEIRNKIDTFAEL